VPPSERKYGKTKASFPLQNSILPDAKTCLIANLQKTLFFNGLYLYFASLCVQRPQIDKPYGKNNLPA